jgi:tetratricopeptide (TPR) repeat protein
LYYDYGNSLSNLNDHLKEAIDAYKACLRLDEFYYLADYNLACVYSRIGMISDAYEELRTALIYGYRNLNYIEKDPDLINLRADSSWESKWEKMKSEIRE